MSDPEFLDLAPSPYISDSERVVKMQGKRIMINFMGFQG
jgi:hypothetical protein